MQEVAQKQECKLHVGWSRSDNTTWFPPHQEHGSEDAAAVLLQCIVLDFFFQLVFPIDSGVKDCKIFPSRYG